MFRFSLKRLLISTTCLAGALGIFQYLTRYYLSYHATVLLQVAALWLIAISIVLLCVQPVVRAVIVGVSLLLPMVLIPIPIGNQFCGLAIIVIAVVAAMVIFLASQPKQSVDLSESAHQTDYPDTERRE